MVQIQIMPEGVEKDDYWIIYPKGVSWFYMMQELLKFCGMDNPTPEIEKELPAFISFAGNGDPVYFFKKEKVTVEHLMRITGMTKDAIEKAEYLQLTETPKEGIPQPTVSYWGRA